MVEINKYLNDYVALSLTSGDKGLGRLVIKGNSFFLEEARLYNSSHEFNELINQYREDRRNNSWNKKLETYEINPEYITIIRDINEEVNKE